MLNLNLLIPAENITRQYQQIHQEIEAAIAEVLPTEMYVLGLSVRAFEEEFSAAWLLSLPGVSANM